MILEFDINFNKVEFQHHVVLQGMIGIGGGVDGCGCNQEGHTNIQSILLNINIHKYIHKYKYTNVYLNIELCQMFFFSGCGVGGSIGGGGGITETYERVRVCNYGYFLLRAPGEDFEN